MNILKTKIQMVNLPKHPLTRLILVLWLTACLAVLIFAFVQRDIHDTDIAVVYFMLFLTFPLGYALSLVIGWLLHLIYIAFNISLPGGFHANLLGWLLFVAVGHYQWFVLVPRFVSKFRRH